MEYNGKYNRTLDEKEEEEEEEEEEGGGEGEMEQEDQEDDKDEDDRVEKKDQKDQKKEKELKKEEVEKRMNKDDTSSHKKYYKCKYAVENSSRFSLRVIEAMRSLQRHENVLPISSVNEIVDYIANNYNNDGDLYAQVRTALKQLCTEGFVIEVLNDEYQLIGPFRTEEMLESCDCQKNGAKIYFSTPKYSKLKRTFRKKHKERSHCLCEKLNEKTKLERNDRKERKEDISPSSRMNYHLNDTILQTPTRKSLRSKIKENNSNKYPEIEKTTMKQKENNSKKLISYEDRHEKSILKVHDDSDDIGSSLREPPSKRMRQMDDAAIETFSDLERYQNINIASNNQSNDQSHDSVFQELKSSIPETSKSHEMELKKWIQRCRRECKKQNKR